MKTKKKSPLKDPSLPFRIYELAKQDMTQADISRITGVSTSTLKKLRDGDGPVGRAFRAARQGSVLSGAVKATQTLTGFVYDRLPPHLQKAWAKIDPAIDTNDPLGEEDTKKLLLKGGTPALQHLFLHAMIKSKFNASEACRLTGVSMKTFADWKVKDPAFAQLVEEVLEHKKNFFESALIQKVYEGDSAAVIFANRTVNRDRGYGEKLSVEHDHKHSLVTLDRVLELLDVETKRKVLDAVERASRPALPEPVQDAEVISVKGVDGD